MTRGWHLGLVCLFAAALPVLADAPARSLRPVARVAAVTAAPVPAAGLAPRTSVRPELRTGQQKRPQRQAAAASAAAVAIPAPAGEPTGLFRKRKLRRGSVCGHIDLQGEKIGRVPGEKKGCGVSDAVRVRSVAGVTLSQPAVMDCDTALALRDWVDKGLQPAFRRQGKVVEIRVAAHYACRTRNSQRGAKISEHGKGKAIDISAFTLKDGRVYTVEESWWRGRARRPMRKAYDKACGTFGTTLGPDADRYHKDHFHFDTARYRSGPYCK